MPAAARTAKFCLGVAGAVAFALVVVEFLVDEEDADATAGTDDEAMLLVALVPVDDDDEEAGMDRWAMSSRQNPPDSSRVQTAFLRGERT